MKRGAWLGIILLVLGIIPTTQALEITALGGFDYSAPSEQQSGVDQRWTGDAGFSYGLLVSSSLSDFLDFESGAIFQSQQLEKPIASGTLTESRSVVQIPLLARLNFDHNIGIGAGYYFGLAQGNITTTQPSGTTTRSYADSNRNTSDSGFLLDLRVRFPLSQTFSLAFDGRYQHGLSNLSTAANDQYHTRSIQVLGGISYWFLPAAEHSSSETEPKKVSRRQSPY